MSMQGVLLFLAELAVYISQILQVDQDREYVYHPTLPFSNNKGILFDLFENPAKHQALVQTRKSEL
jgi:flagellar basal body rod protein FlgC